jgi:hypothetical protein
MTRPDQLSTRRSLAAHPLVLGTSNDRLVFTTTIRRSTRSDSLNALRQEPSTNNHAIRLEPDLADAEISRSAVTANALNLLRRAAEIGGLKLTATGNLSRAVVEEMFLSTTDRRSHRFSEHRMDAGTAVLHFARTGECSPGPGRSAGAPANHRGDIPLISFCGSSSLKACVDTSTDLVMSRAQEGSVMPLAECNSLGRLTSLTAQWVLFISHFPISSSKVSVAKSAAERNGSIA